MQDLEQVEEWNEFGELRMVVNSVEDLGGLPATSNPLPTTGTETKPSPTTPKPSTIKIQNPPVSNTEDKKDDMTVAALRQASTEAASKAKANASEKERTKEEQVEKEVPHSSRAHRGSVACELPDDTPESPNAMKRPTLVPETAAVSSANFHADNAEMLGLVAHHRGSRVPTLENPGQDEAVNELRKSISQESTGGLDAIRKEAATKMQAGSPIEEVPTPLVNDADVVESKEEPKESPIPPVEAAAVAESEEKPKESPIPPVDDAAVAETKEELKEPNEPPQGQAIAEIIAKAVEEPQEAQEEIKRTQEAVEASSPPCPSLRDDKENTEPIQAQIPKSAE